LAWRLAPRLFLRVAIAQSGVRKCRYTIEAL